MSKKIVLDLNGDSLAKWRSVLNRAAKYFSKTAAASQRAGSTDAPRYAEAAEVLNKISDQLRDKR